MKTMRWKLIEFAVIEPKEIAYRGVMTKNAVELIAREGSEDVLIDGVVEPCFPEREFDARWCRKLSNATLRLGAAHYGEDSYLSLNGEDCQIEACVSRPRFFDEEGNDITPTEFPE